MRPQALALALAAGCGADVYAIDDDPQTLDHLERLESLEVLDVGEVLVQTPPEATNCYGPCDDADEGWAREEEKAAERLAAFAELAEEATQRAEVDAYFSCDPDGAASDLDALRELQVVEILGMTDTSTDEEGRPVLDDNNDCERAGKLAAIAHDAVRADL